MTSAAEVLEGTLMTVLGPIPSHDAGFTLSHEHLWISLWEIKGRYDYRAQYADESLLGEELSLLKARGGGTIVDVTTAGIGRHPEGLARISSSTGLNVVMGSGWYREPYYPAEDSVDRRSVDELASTIISEFEDGVGDTGIRPGVIGEIGVDRTWVSAQEERVHRAAARAAIETGMAVTTHSIGGTGLAQLRIFEEEGLEPSRVVVGHVDDHPEPQYFLDIVREGAYLGFDRVGNLEPFFTERTARTIAHLFELGYGDRVLVSHDVCARSQLTAFGGNGYVFIHDTFLQMLMDVGLSTRELDQVFEANPARVFTLCEKEQQS